MRTLSTLLISTLITALSAGSAQAQGTSLTINNSGASTLNVSGGSLTFLGVALSTYGTWDYDWTLLKDGSEIQSQSETLTCDGYSSCPPPLFHYQIPAGCMTGTYSLKLKVSRFFIPTSRTESNSIAVRAPGSPTPVLKVNGQRGPNINVCAAGPITVDASQTTCTSGYFLGMELSDIYWGVQSAPSTRWLTGTDFARYGPLNNFDAKRFYQDRYFAFVPGQYYRLTLATDPWVDTTSLLHIVGSTASLKINGSQASPTLVDAAGPILLDGTTSTCADGYFVSVQLSDPSWHRFGPEAMRWLSAADLQKYGPINHFDVKRFAQDQDLPHFPFAAGDYYRVKLAVGTPWSESTVLIRVTAWTPWLNSDTPGGGGDLELLSNFIQAGTVCPHPLDIQCQTVNGVDWKAAGQAYTCDVKKGGICIWSLQNQCFDYHVRFLC